MSEKAADEAAFLVEFCPECAPPSWKHKRNLSPDHGVTQKAL
jgi:hypothetical protein